MEYISSKSNTMVKEYVKLTKDKSYRNTKGFFVIEGVKLILEAYKSGVEFEMIFVTEDCYYNNNASYELEKLFQFVNEQKVKSTFISEDISKKITTQNSPQGIYAICKNIQNTFSKEQVLDKENNKYIMLCDLQDAGNVGTIIRTAEALGVAGIIVSANTCDLYSLKVIRGSMGSIFRVKILIVENTMDFLEYVKNKIKTYASVVTDDAISLKNVEFDDSCILLIGNEGNGLEQEIVDLCDIKITIKMVSEIESLNVSTATSIMMWEMLN